MKRNHYEVLGIQPGCGFQEIKKAYYCRVKECHPDLYSGSRLKEEEFKILVASFDILSDPDKRRNYDDVSGIKRIEPEVEIVFAPSETEFDSIMDSSVDDTLEELIVGNEPPENTSLATLFLDLQKTEVFIMFREGKNYYSEKKYKAALYYFRKVLSLSPNNIIYRYYLAKTCSFVGDYRDAEFHLNAGISLGKKRIPPQRLKRFHDELELLGKKQHPWWQKVISIFKNNSGDKDYDCPEEKMIHEANRAISRIIQERKKGKDTEGKHLNT